MCDEVEKDVMALRMSDAERLGVASFMTEWYVLYFRRLLQVPSALVKGIYFTSNSFQLPARACFAGTQTLDFWFIVECLTTWHWQKHLMMSFAMMSRAP